MASVPPRGSGEEGGAVEVVALCVTVLLALAGFVVNDRAAQKAKRRDIRTQFLLSAYSRIEVWSNRPLDEAGARVLDEAVSDVQLLGTERQVVAARRFAKAFAVDGSAPATELLDALRSDLRADLDLDPIELGPTHLRIDVAEGAVAVRWFDAARVSATAIAGSVLASGRTLGALTHMSAPAAAPIPAPDKTADEAWLDLVAALAAVGVSVPKEGGPDPAETDGVLSPQMVAGVRSLRVMRDLLGMDRRAGQGDPERESEFVAYSSAMTSLIEAGLAGPASM